jgi:hypothetical protein
MWFPTLTTAVFDLDTPFDFLMGSNELLLLGSPLVRYMMPSAHNIRFLKLIVYQAFELLSPVKINLNVMLTGRMFDAGRPDGKMVEDDRVKVDFGVQVEEEWGRISLEDFD